MLNISRIQHFSVGDGDGIRTTVFFKGCNLRCPWCHNPENLSFEPCVLHYENEPPETSGRLITADELTQELLEDKPFYDSSGGGVTFSGGEVLLQAEKTAELAKRLLNEGVTVLVDTAGCVPYNAFKRLNPYITGYLLDYKTADRGKYRQIGGDLSLLTENIKRLKEDNIPFRIRIPLIPNFNTDEISITEICENLKALNILEVELLPFHRLGSSKYTAMGLDYAYKDIPPISADILSQIKQQYSKFFKITTEI